MSGLRLYLLGSARVVLLLSCVVLVVSCGRESEPILPLVELGGSGCAAAGCHASTVLGEFPTTSVGHVSQGGVAGRGHVFRIECVACHYNYDWDPAHRDGRVSRENVVRFPPVPQSASFEPVGKTCANNGCHVTQAWSGATGNFNRAGGDCTSCHGAPYSYAPMPLSGKHALHMNTYFATGGRCAVVPGGLAAQGLHTCTACHNNHFSSPLHGDGTLQSGPSIVSLHPTADNGAPDACGAAATYTSKTAPSCSGCHAPLQWGQ